MLRAGGTDEKERMVRTMHKLKAAVHAVVSPAGLLEAKKCTHGAIRKRTERTKERLDLIKGGKLLFFLPYGGRTSGSFDAKSNGLMFKNVVPTKGRKLFFKKR